MFLAQNICLQQRGRHRNITYFVAMEHNLSQEQWSKIDLFYFAPVLRDILFGPLCHLTLLAKDFFRLMLSVINPQLTS